MVEKTGVIHPVQKIVFRNEGDQWVVEGFALMVQEQSGKITKIPIQIIGRKFDAIPDGAKIVGLDFAPRIQVSMAGVKGIG